MKTIDLRSDTVTKPTPSMWKAMMQAELGDDVYGDDPTVNHLEKRAAEILGKEAALFVASGTMGNLVAVMTHCKHGDEAILGKNSHVFQDEVGGIAALAGVMPNTLPNQVDGTLKIEEIKSAIRPDDIHCPPPRLVILENTHGECGGVPLSYDYMNQVSKLTHQYGLKLHVDGARFFNASVALKVNPRKLAEPLDSLTFCLSKGLCAPIGSMLVGTGEFIHAARKVRKQLGAGMRQVGILAAAGIVALEENIDRLDEDHRRMKDFAKGIEKIEGFSIDFRNPPATNMLFVTLNDSVSCDAEEIRLKLKDQAVLCNGGNRRLRFLTHYWISDEDVAEAVQRIASVMKKVV
jgi:threonine aldolase